ncbi:hypothetical protein L226DRAFT_458116 [Lentinus tigrinus ALCF2SS1-7]|uniref:PAS domain-containing protein n=1 Tax=Lentinus tigrinus ALCF2SS1-6 TaxID=1328759 RepID=A0A5C2SG18_9APHY|nr:hypothetical protein L227DRAFT_544655 [Lentinus tigrinus ALCF2SS1-6]RPD77974.1 hypothetical protein L226DRAFT_458116 [Lentinus tigrinus ALCF2SS1-7]
MDSSPACVSFIGIVDFTEDAKWVYCSESVYDLLGYEPHELIGTPSLDLVHPDEFSEVKELHFTTITSDQAAVLAYLRMKHKDPYKGYILCGISRTVCQNVLVGSVSFASPGPKAMHNASTAQEVKIITPTAKDLEFRRWNDPNPMPPGPAPASRSVSPDYGRRRDPRANAITFDPLPEQSIRTALILDRFSVNCGILYCSNDSLIATTACMGRSFFDFVSRKDEDLVRSWIDVIKSWGVNERGQPSDGGFGFGKFSLLTRGRDSSIRHPDPVPSRHRSGPHGTGGHSRASESHSQARARDGRPPYHHSSSGGAGAGYRDRERDRDRYRDRDRDPRAGGRMRADEERIVDAIFSAHSDGLMVILRPTST